MPFRIAKSITIESGHLLTKYPGACRFPHGHSRTVEVVVTAEALNAQDMVCDFKALKAAVTTAAEHFDHAFALNTTDQNYAAMRAAYGERVIGFAETDPTSEVLARTIFHAVRNHLAPGIRLERVRVTETASSWAEYWE